MKLRGLDEAMANLQRLAHRSQATKEQVELALAKDLLAKARQLVPLDTGRLRASGFIDQTRSRTRVGYNTPYAAKLHYSPGFNFQRGRSAFFLQDPATTLPVNKLTSKILKNNLKL